MADDLKTPLTGVISAAITARNGLRLGVVTLDEPVGGLTRAFIGTETKGRSDLMRMTSDHSLPEGMRVVIEEYELGSEVVRALKIAKA